MAPWAAIQVDGVLSEPAWQEAWAERTLVFPWSKRPAPATELRAVADRQRLYFAFDVTDDDVVVEREFRGKETVMGEDRVEVFFARDAALERYFCMEIDPLGRVLDYGCGSGILAIGAAKFGATDIDAVDIDPAAVESTVQNAQANQVTLKAGLPDKAQGEYQTVLANILATPLRVLAPLLCSHVAAGGHLVLAGILERQADELKEAYAPWLPLQVADSEDGWILMTASR